MRPIDFKQWDRRWANEMYSSHNDKHQTMRNSGSGPTLAADIVATLKDGSVTPMTLARQAVEWGYRTYNCGTGWGFFAEVAIHYGFRRFVETNNFDMLKDCIDAGGYVVCNMAPGYWGRNTNYVLAWAYDDRYVYCNHAEKNKYRQCVDGFIADCKRYFCFYP